MQENKPPCLRVLLMALGQETKPPHPRASLMALLKILVILGMKLNLLAQELLLWLSIILGKNWTSLPKSISYGS